MASNRFVLRSIRLTTRFAASPAQLRCNNHVWAVVRSLFQHVADMPCKGHTLVVQVFHEMSYFFTRHSQQQSAGCNSVRKKYLCDALYPRLKLCTRQNVLKITFCPARNSAVQSKSLCTAKDRNALQGQLNPNSRPRCHL